MQKLSIAKTIRGYFLAPQLLAATEDDDSETEEEADEDDYNFELGEQNLSSGGSGLSVNHVRLRKTAGSILAFNVFCGVYFMKFQN